MTYRILIVDDQKEVSRLLRSALETIEVGLVVSEAPSGEEAILESTRAKFDLLIADYRLPGINGMQLMKKFRARNPEIKVIMVTGVTDPKLQKEVRECGADAFFIKPVSIGDFLDTVERTLGLARTIVQPVVKLTPEEERRNTLADFLVNLRKDLKAQVVLLLNNQGHVEAEAGDLPDQNKAASLISSLMGMFNAAQKVASILSHAENHLHLFNSDQNDGIFMPVGTTHALLLIGKGLADVKNLAKNLERLSTTRVDILSTLNKAGIVESAEIPVEPELVVEEPVEVPTDFDNLLKQAGQKPVDASSFWNSAVEKGTSFTEPDKLTFEQASRLGLAPSAPAKTGSGEAAGDKTPEKSSPPRVDSVFPPASVIEPVKTPLQPGPIEKESDELLAGFDDLFKQVGQKPLDAGSFWDSAVEKGTSFNDPDKLTFEQASRMGLTPDAPTKTGTETDAKSAEKPSAPRVEPFGTPVKPEPVEEESDDLLAGLDDLFKQAGQKAVDAGSFWDSAVEKGTSFADPDKLTFEQASRMGLAPGEMPKAGTSPTDAKSAEKAPPAKPEPVAEEGDDLAGLDDLFKQAGQKAVDAGSFWDSAVEKGTSFADPDKLTFEQAARMGLAPGETAKMGKEGDDDAKSAEKASPARAESASTPVQTKPLAEESDELLAGLDDLFKQAAQKAVDASSFWDSAVEKGTSFADPDKLTFEQASRMGLTPDTDKNKKK